MAAPPRLSVVVPVHNEAGVLQSSVAEILDQLAPLEADVDVCLAENGSTDDTGRLADSLAATDERISVIHLTAPDYGAAMRAGFLGATGDWVVNFDIDYYSADFLRAVLASDADLVLASKRAPGAHDQRPPLRRLATWGFNVILRTLLGSTASDTHGMKGVRRHVVTDVGPRVISTEDLFDTELVIRAQRAGYTIEEVPATVEETRKARSGIWSRVPRTLLGLLRLRWRLWRE